MSYDLICPCVWWNEINTGFHAGISKTPVPLSSRRACHVFGNQEMLLEVALRERRELLHSLVLLCLNVNGL